MFNTTGTGYTLADIAAVSGNNNNKNNGFFGEDGWWIILLFLFAGGGWGNGFGFGGNRGGEIAYSFDFNELENGVKGIQQGLCDGFYAINTGMLTGFNGVQNTLCQGFSGVNSSVNALGTQMAQCCCDLRYENAKNFADLGYALATQSCDTRRAIADSTRDLIENNNAGNLGLVSALNGCIKLTVVIAESADVVVAPLLADSGKGIHIVSDKIHTVNGVLTERSTVNSSKASACVIVFAVGCDTLTHNHSVIHNEGIS